uniref:Uncharacterized protein n=1 Tax=Panagrolaimus sp. ES5 TaxID=591445 RepID=A0AC34FH38_9BILA
MSERAEKRAHAAEENGEDVVVAKQSKSENGKDKTEEKIETVKEGAAEGGENDEEEDDEEEEEEEEEE